jgi:hypothetical protein
MKTSSREVCPRRPDSIPRHKSGKARIANGTLRARYLTVSVVSHLDNRSYAGGAKESDEQKITPPRGKTTTKRSQRRERPAPAPLGPSRVLSSRT